MPRIGVFCGSSPGARAEYVLAAREFGRVLAERGLGMVYGGAGVGLMAAAADAVLAGGGEVIGVIPRALAEKELAHRGLTELYEVETMHARKALMADLSDGFAALPGGLGTLDEVFEILTWAQLGFHAKPCGFLNVCGYWDGLFHFLDHAAGERFLTPEHRAMILAAPNALALLEAMAGYTPPTAGKWFGP